jgi:hypothetical protein
MARSPRSLQKARSIISSPNRFAGGTTGIGITGIGVTGAGGAGTIGTGVVTGTAVTGEMLGATPRNVADMLTA